MMNVMAGQKVINVYQGEFEISSRPDEVLVTVLGSCIAACLYDPVRAVGGLNHFLLPGGAGNQTNQRYGVNAMELLINGLLRAGAERGRLQAKVFGGARMMDEFADIGRSNAVFALDFLKEENIPCIAQSTLGDQARRIRFWPTSGRAQQFLVPRREVEELPVHVPPKPQVEDDILLF